MTNPLHEFENALIASRIASRVAGNKGDPKPKFKLGDKVKDKDGSREGVVSFVGEYDSYIKGYRYKVKEPSGKRQYWNETSMVKVK
jgi:hypothetical protein